jgi:hypothetical protein
MTNPLLLAVFTVVDVLIAPLGLAANLRAVFRKPGAARAAVGPS